MSKALKYHWINDLNYHVVEINRTWYKTYTIDTFGENMFFFVHAYNSYTWSISPDWALYILFYPWMNIHINMNIIHTHEAWLGVIYCYTLRMLGWITPQRLLHANPLSHNPTLSIIQIQVSNGYIISRYPNIFINVSKYHTLWFKSMCPNIVQWISTKYPNIFVNVSKYHTL